MPKRRKKLKNLQKVKKMEAKRKNRTKKIGKKSIIKAYICNFGMLNLGKIVGSLLG